MNSLKIYFSHFFDIDEDIVENYGAINVSLINDMPLFVGLFLLFNSEKEEKPFMDSEPRYEDHPACFNKDIGYLWNAHDVRNNAYWNLMEGVCGHTYGNHSIWSFNTKEQPYWPYRWQDALLHDGANQISNMVKLRKSRDFFSFTHAPELVEYNNAVMSHQSAGKGSNYAFIYTPQGLPIRADLHKFSDKNIKALWFNPRTGEEHIFKVFPPKQLLIAPPSYGKDWVLILDEVM